MHQAQHEYTRDQKCTHSERLPILDVDLVQSAGGKIYATAATSAQTLFPALPVTDSAATTLEAVNYDNPVDPEPRCVSPSRSRAQFELIGFRVVWSEGIVFRRR